MFKKRILTAVSVLAIAGLGLAACSSGDTGNGGTDADGAVTLTFRTWDTNAQAAYEKSFEEFTKQNPDITVNVESIPWGDYFTKLRTDVAGNSAADLYWINASSYKAYAQAGSLVDINELYGADFEATQAEWAPGVVDQFTNDGTLYGIPQASDGGIALYYNAELLKAAGMTPEDISGLTWAPGGGDKDTLIKALQKLTVDKAGKTADDATFDAKSIQQYGYNAAQDLQAIYLPYIGSNGGTFQDGDKFTLTDPKTVEAYQYIVDLINEYHVAPSAADTNTNGDFSRDQFLQGNMATFQSGLYNLANVADSAKFDWGVTMLPEGPAGAVSVSNGVAVVGNADSKNAAATEKALKWLGTTEGNSPIGADGANLPGVLAAQQGYQDFWKTQDVDIQPFFKVLEDNDTIPAPVGANFGAASEAFGPIFSEMFLGQKPVPEALKQANEAANAVVE
ncbi:multiple sugar transport system substrate-binding protein [Leucobacter exalbidus]|uniref:Multiple sugar transport system substrate-binding protein n=1 Tax=Leucobacter exalbidus TaxID=662960 RepID=A0A940PLI0_9MICO|nr:sugar ABC transporter substrate-binding protein [Leucobacter exalbidus]MBP1325330.1 multiple sugar transport system substrate-binding protein [Leucobacter exalbidus]